jgi:hypothetical protein
LITIVQFVDRYRPGPTIVDPENWTTS